MSSKEKRPELVLEKRKVVGRKVKQLRKLGMLPGNIYGKEIESLAVQVLVKEFEKVFKEVGETGLLDAKVDGEVRPVLVHQVQLDPVEGTPLHVDFKQVSLKEKTEVKVPVVISGEAPAEKQGGVVVQMLNEVEVAALPTDLPEEIIADAATLAEIGSVIKVGDLVVDRKKVEVKTDAEQIVVKVEAPVAEEEVVAEVAAEVPVEGAGVEEGGEKPVGEKNEGKEKDTPQG